MISILKKQRTVYMVAQHQLDAKDYKNLILELIDNIKTHLQVYWYIEKENFEGWTVSAYRN